VRSCWLLGGGGSTAGDVGERGHAQADRVAPAGDEPVDLGELGFRGCEADFEALGFAEPAFPLGLADAGGQVAADVCEPLPLAWLDTKERAPNAPLTELSLMFGQVAA
jgi:hypothetical protein